MVLSIRGAQVTPPIPNNVQPECICVPKVYDFVVFTEDIDATVALPTPTPVGCPAVVTDITCALVTESFFPLSCETNGVCMILERRSITLDGVNAALVKLRQEIPVDVTFTGTDVFDAPASCTVRLVVPFVQQVILCFPPEFTNENLICRILSGDCMITTPPPVGGQPFPTSIGVELFVCKEIQVLAAVKLEVLAKFCSPRASIAPTAKSICPITTFLEQCSFFPQPNCNCESRVNTTANFGDRTQTLIATICDSCAPVNSSVFFQSINPTDPTDVFNLVFTANSISTESCTSREGGTLIQTVTGTGTLQRGGSTFEASYILQLIEGPIDTYSISMQTSSFIISFLGFPAPDDQFIVTTCTQFP